ncbi:hypothetical protein E2C01_017015 [Portunus trituberculatus]|uniref:Uncharacterized protein n=1 Tax=Portunus trituberculatus TaxID=210409 RepID=A0A5B7DR99_PORTR|nr:hypothetical protein [Portunus trituberculatus]
MYTTIHISITPKNLGRDRRLTKQGPKRPPLSAGLLASVGCTARPSAPLIIKSGNEGAAEGGSTPPAPIYGRDTQLFN